MSALEQTKQMLQAYGHLAIDVADKGGWALAEVHTKDGKSAMVVATTPHETKLLLAFAARRAAVAEKRLAKGGA